MCTHVPFCGRTALLRLQNRALGGDEMTCFKPGTRCCCRQPAATQPGAESLQPRGHTHGSTACGRRLPTGARKATPCGRKPKARQTWKHHVRQLSSGGRCGTLHTLQKRHGPRQGGQQAGEAPAPHHCLRLDADPGWHACGQHAIYMCTRSRASAVQTALTR